MHPKSPSLSATTVKCLSALPSVLPESLFLKCLRLQQSYVFQTKLLHTLPISFQWGKEVSVGITGFHTYVSLMLLCKSSPLSVLLLIKVNYPAMTCYGHFSFGLLLHGGPATPIACSRFSGTLSLFPAEYSLSGDQYLYPCRVYSCGKHKIPSHWKGWKANPIPVSGSRYSSCSENSTIKPVLI